MKELEGMDSGLVEIIDGRPHCKLHGAMNKVNPSGVWRCISTYIVIQTETKPKYGGNGCRAGCVIEEQRKV